MKFKYPKLDLRFVIGIVGIILVGIYIWLRKKTKEGFQSSFPKILWTYWNTEDLPQSVQMCIASWRKYAPNYEIRLLHKETLHHYVKLPKEILEHPNFNDSQARFSDLLRLHLLAEYGGIWMDASILMTERLDDWLSLDSNQDFFAYYNDGHTKGGKYPVLESWFLVAKKDSPFANAWCREFLRMSEFPTVSAYLQSLRDNGVRFDTLEGGGADYLAVFISCIKLLQKDNYPIETIKIAKAEDGPYKYNTMWGGDLSKSLPYACENPSVRKPMMKLTRFERGVLEDHFNDTLSNEKCHWL